MPSSYFSPLEDSLDPTLFGDGYEIRGTVRTELLSLLHSCLAKHFKGSKKWARAWIAGSGVSYQWGANNDLDVLVGIKFEDFRYSNPSFRQMSDLEISKHINEIFRQELQPLTADWHGYEVTFFVNQGSWDIRTILPYAAYSLTDNDWTVEPPRNPPTISPEWEQEASSLHQRAQEMVSRYAAAHTSLMNAPHATARQSAERDLKNALGQSAALFHQIHEGRKVAFGPGGFGYSDRHNFLWQAGKRDGWLPALKEMKDYHDKMTAEDHLATYGVELPTTDVLIRRAAASYAAQAASQNVM